MPLSLTRVTDGINDILASHQNEKADAIEANATGIPLADADYVNTQTLSATLTLTNASDPLQFLDPGGAGRQVNLPAEAATNHPFYIVNTADAAETLTVKAFGGGTIDTVNQGEAKLFVSNGVAWRALSGGGAANSNISGPQSFLINGKILPSVTTNNLTVAIRTLAGTAPSATDPVYVRIGDTIRSITAALSVTVNAGTNWFNAGSAELATKEIDYFVYLGYNATDGVVIGFSRIPYANQYGDFSATSTNEKYAAISTITNAVSTDYYENIGRFAATLSAGAGYTWTVPTFTAINLINHPIVETRWLTWVPTITGFSIAPGSAQYLYQVAARNIYVLMAEPNDGTSNATTKTYTTAFVAAAVFTAALATPRDNSAFVASGAARISAGSNIMNMYTSAFGAWTASGSCRMVAFNGFYPISIV